jgi:stage IV sporulation protein B
MRWSYIDTLVSGSPILQDGRLVGAVTHVLVEDPTRGYAIFTDNMLETAQSVAESHRLKEAS